MPFYEVIFETGSHSIISADDDDQALQGLKEHHERAQKGIPGGPVGNPAERIVRVLKYDKHPADHAEDQTLSSEVANKTIAELVKDLDADGVISLPELAAAIRNLSDPFVESGPHDTNYAMQEAGELKWQ